MKLNRPYTAEEIAELVDGEIIGKGKDEIKGINEIHKVVSGDLSFVDHPKYYKKCIDSAASVILINDKVDEGINPKKKTLILHQDPIAAYNILVKHFIAFHPQPEMIHTSAIIGEGTEIQPGVFIAENVEIGENCILHSGVHIQAHTLIGDNVIVGSGSILGGDAFYFNKKNDTYRKLESSGRVVIEDNVEIGSACTIDRGVSGDTIIGQGSKLDNQVHIGHGVEVGKNCLLAAQVGIGGKTIVRDNVIMWGQVGVNKDIEIGEGAIILGKSGVSKSLEGGKTYFGYPADEARTVYRKLGWLSRLPELFSKK